MKGLLQNKKLLIGLGVVVAGIAVLVLTGTLKFSASVRKTEPTTTEETKEPEETRQQQRLSPRAVTFKGVKTGVTMSIKLPLGWVTGKDARADLIAGSQTPEKLDNGQTFTANINASVGKHPTGVTSFADIEKGWKEGLLDQYPSMEIVADSSKKINGLDVYELEVKNTRPDGVVVHQIQYVFYLDDTYMATATGSVPNSVWDKYGGVIKDSIESLERVEE